MRHEDADDVTRDEQLKPEEDAAPNRLPKLAIGRVEGLGTGQTAGELDSSDGDGDDDDPDTDQINCKTEAKFLGLAVRFRARLDHARIVGLHGQPFSSSMAAWLHTRGVLIDARCLRRDLG